MKSFAVWTVLFGLSVGLAQGMAPLKLTLSRSLVLAEQKDGKALETFKTDFSGAKPGDVLLEQVTVENVGAKALSSVKVKLPLPQNAQGNKVLGKTNYLAGSATASSNRWTLEFSFDGGTTFAREPLLKTVKVQEGGKTVEKQVRVEPSEYTHARWTLERLSPKEKLVFGLRARVN